MKQHSIRARRCRHEDDEKTTSISLPAPWVNQRLDQDLIICSEEKSCVQTGSEMNFLSALMCSRSPRSATDILQLHQLLHLQLQHANSGTHRCRDARKLQNPPAIDSNQREEETEREGGDRGLIVLWMPQLSQGFFPTYPLYTTSKRFALWNRLCHIWANRGAARGIFKRAANQRAAEPGVGVSLRCSLWCGGAQLGWRCAASSVQLGWSDSSSISIHLRPWCLFCFFVVFNLFIFYIKVL